MNIVCYRCGGGENPENTFLGIEHCQKVNDDWPIEMDLQMTKDGEIVLFHDKNTKRISGIDKNIEEMDFIELKSLNMGYNFQRNGAYIFRERPVEIPLLKDVFKQYPKVKFVLDVHTEKKEIVEKIISMVESNNIANQITIVSGYDDIIKLFKKQKPEWKYAAATNEAKRLIYSSFVLLDSLFPLQSDYLMIPLKYGKIKVLTKRIVHHVKRRNKDIWAWMYEGEEVKTVETVAEATALFNIGANSVFTDFPKKLSDEISTR